MTWPLPEFTQFTMNADNIMSHNLSQPRIRTTVTARRVIEGGKYAMYSQVWPYAPFRNNERVVKIQLHLVELATFLVRNSNQNLN